MLSLCINHVLRLYFVTTGLWQSFSQKWLTLGLDTLPLSNPLAPAVAPRDVQTTRINGTHMNISWELPTLEEARGFIDTITITFTPTSGGLQRKKRQIVTVQVPGNSTSKVIGGLNPDLQYSVTVGTSTSEGAGPEATAVVPSKNLIQVMKLKLGGC